MTGPPAGPGNRPPAATHPPQDQHRVGGAPSPAEAPATPLSPALDKTFKIGLVLKGLDGVLEVIGGTLLLFLSPAAIQHLARVLTAHELRQDPHDLIARYLLHTTANLHHGTTLFGAVYLLSHGIAKIVLVALVLKDKLWAYPWLIGLLLAFIGYQLYQITAVHFSAGLALLTVFDAFLVWLTWREYRAKRAMRHRIKAPAAVWSSQDRPGTDGGQERAAEVAGSADASGAGGRPAQQQAGHAHGRPQQAGSAEHPAANAVRDMRLDEGGKGGVAGGGDPVAHQRGDAGKHEAGQPAPPQRGDHDNAAAGAGGRPGQQDQAGGAARGDGREQPVSAAGGVQPPGGQDNQQSSGRPGDDHPDWP